MFGQWVQDMERERLENWWQGRLRKGSSRPCRIHLKNLLNGWHKLLLDETQPPFPGSELAQWNHGWNGNDSRIGARHGITKPLLSVQVARNSDQSWVGDIPQAPGQSANHLEASRFHWPFLIIEGVVIWPLKYTYSRLRFPFPACCASVSTTIRGLRECVIHCYCVSHHIASDQQTHSVMKEVTLWAIARRIHWSNCIFYHQEA